MPDEHSELDGVQISSPPGDLNAPAAPGAPTVAQEIVCMSCGYNLMTAARDGRCPECNTPVARSLRGDHLFNADPVWVVTLRNGITLVLINGLVGFILGLAAALIRSPQLTAIISAINAVLSIIGMWMITAPEPKAWRAEENVTLRKALRTFAVVSFVGTLLQAANLLARNQGLNILAQTLVFLGLVSFILYYLHLSRLAQRLPNRTLARQFRVIMWGLTIPTAALIPLALFAGLLREAALLMLCPISALVLVFGLWSLLAQLRFRSEIAAAAELARMNAATDLAVS